MPRVQDRTGRDQKGRDQKGRDQKGRVQNRPGRDQTDRDQGTKSAQLSQDEIILASEKANWPMDRNGDQPIVTTEVKNNAIKAFLKATSASALAERVCAVCEELTLGSNGSTMPINSIPNKEILLSPLAINSGTPTPAEDPSDSGNTDSVLLSIVRQYF